MTIASAFANLVVMSVSGTPGAGTITLNAAVAPYFGTTELTDQGVYAYEITDGGNVCTGHGTYTAASKTLTRDPAERCNVAGVPQSTPMALTSGAVVTFTGVLGNDLVATLSPMTQAALSGGLIYNNGAGSAAATSGISTDGVKLSMVGSASEVAAVLTNALESVNVIAAAPAATQNFYVNTGAVQLFTTNAANNWTLNIAHSNGTALNAALAVGQAVTIAVLTTQGATAYYNSAVTIDGGAITPKWQGGTAPSAGNATGIDVYTYTIVKTANATFTVLASLVQF
jgi:hypothetical protein